MVLVDPRAGRDWDTAVFLTLHESLLGFSRRPLAAAWRERHQIAATFLVVRSQESLDRLALTAVMRCGLTGLLRDPGPSQDRVDLWAWLRSRASLSAPLYEFARARGWEGRLKELVDPSVFPEKRSR